MLRRAVGALGRRFPGLPIAASSPALQQLRGLKWSPELEPQTYKSADEIIDGPKIDSLLESTKEQAKDVGRIKAILEAAKDRSFLKDVQPGGGEVPQAGVSRFSLSLWVARPRAPPELPGARPPCTQVRPSTSRG